MFTAGGKARVFDCTIIGVCRTMIYELPGATVESGEEIEPRTIYQESHFRTAIVSDPVIYLSNSSFSPHYARNCALRHDIDEELERLRKENSGTRDRLFVVMEEYRPIDPVRMSKGECLAINQEAIRGGTSGNEAILALRSKDGAWPEEGVDVASENFVLAAIKIEQSVTYGMKALIESVNFVERNGGIVHIQEGYAELAFGALRVERKLSDSTLGEKAKKLSSSRRLPARLVRGDIAMLSDGDAFRLARRPPHLDRVDLASGRIHPYAEAGQVPVPEQRVAALDGQGLHRPLGNSDGLLSWHSSRPASVSPNAGPKSVNE